MNTRDSILREVKPEPRYTLAQLSALAREYIDDARDHWTEGDVVEVELQLSLWLAWLQKKG